MKPFCIWTFSSTFCLLFSWYFLGLIKKEYSLRPQDLLNISGIFFISPKKLPIKLWLTLTSMWKACSQNTFRSRPSLVKPSLELLMSYFHMGWFSFHTLLQHYLQEIPRPSYNQHFKKWDGVLVEFLSDLPWIPKSFIWRNFLLISFFVPPVVFHWNAMYGKVYKMLCNTTLQCIYYVILRGRK